MLTADPPRFDDGDVPALARRTFGFEGEVERRFESERDQNFLLRAAGGEGRILKISNAGERADVLDMEVGAAALHALACRSVAADRGAVPDRRRCRRATWHRCATRSAARPTWCACRRSCRGGARPTASTSTTRPCGPTARRSRGSAGRCAGFFHPAADRVLLWNVEHCLTLRPMTAAIADPERRALVRRVFDRFEERVLPRWPGAARPGDARRPHARQRPARRRRAHHRHRRLRRHVAHRADRRPRSRRSTRCCRSAPATSSSAPPRPCSTATDRSPRSSPRSARCSATRSRRASRSR